LATEHICGVTPTDKWPISWPHIYGHKVDDMTIWFPLTEDW